MDDAQMFFLATVILISVGYGTDKPALTLAGVAHLILAFWFFYMERIVV